MRLVKLSGCYLLHVLLTLVQVTWLLEFDLCVFHYIVIEFFYVLVECLFCMYLGGMELPTERETSTPEC